MRARAHYLLLCFAMGFLRIFGPPNRTFPNSSFGKNREGGGGITVLSLSMGSQRSISVVTPCEPQQCNSTSSGVRGQMPSTPSLGHSNHSG